MDFDFRKAALTDASAIWDILQNAILRRKQEGSLQWQNGYPSQTNVMQDILKGVGYVLTQHHHIVGFCAVLVNDEPAYANIQGKWLTDDDFLVVHRIAIAKEYVGNGWAKTMLGQIEGIARNLQITSIRADTNFDNEAMLKTFEKSGYIYCGEVMMRGGVRKAFEKIIF